MGDKPEEDHLGKAACRIGPKGIPVVDILVVGILVVDSLVVDSPDSEVDIPDPEVDILDQDTLEEDTTLEDKLVDILAAVSHDVPQQQLTQQQLT